MDGAFEGDENREIYSLVTSLEQLESRSMHLYCPVLYIVLYYLPTTNPNTPRGQGSLVDLVVFRLVAEKA